MIKKTKWLICLSLMCTVLGANAETVAPALTSCEIAPRGGNVEIVAWVDIPEGVEAELVAVLYSAGRMARIEHVPAESTVTMLVRSSGADAVKVFLVNSWDEFVPLGVSVTKSLT